MFQSRVTLLPGTELKSARFNKMKKYFSRNIHGVYFSPMFPSLPYGKHCFQCQFLFPRCKLCLCYTAGNFNTKPSMWAVSKILQARAREHLTSNFCKQFKQRPNFVSTFKLNGTIRYPLLAIANCTHWPSHQQRLFTGGLRTVWKLMGGL